MCALLEIGGEAARYLTMGKRDAPLRGLLRASFDRLVRQ
jgi:hypothetical protein